MLGLRMSQSELPIYLQYLQALTLPILASAGVWIAFVQARTARHKLQLDLFDKRIEVFLDTEDFISTALLLGSVENSTFPKLYRAMGKARLLFESDVEDFLKAVNDTAARWHAAAAQVEAATGQIREARVTAEYVQKEKFDALNKKLVSVFAPYMDFRSIRKDRWYI